MLNDALAITPSTYTIYDSSGSLTFGEGSHICTPLGGNIYISENGKVRSMNNKDIIDQFKLGETSPVMTSSYLYTLLDLNGMTEEQKIFHPIAMHLRYSNKPNFPMMANVLRVNPDRVYDVMKKGYKLARDFLGIYGDKPIMQCGLNALAPLTYDQVPLERMFASLDEHCPIRLSSCGLPLLTSPPSIVGLLSTVNAEVLAGLVLCQLYQPGNAVLYGNVSGSTDMRTLQLCMGSPEAALICYGTAAMADRYNLPFRANGPLSDAKDCDVQAGAETMMMAFATYDSGADWIFHAAGSLGTYNIVSFEQYLIDEEIIGMVQRILKGIDCTDKKLAYKEISETGSRGTYLKGKTPKMYREDFFMAKYFNKDDCNHWQEKGSITVKENAAKAVKERIESYVVPERTKDQLKLIEPYLPKAYKYTI